MEIRQNFSLLAFNTFGIDVSTKYFAAFSDVEELAETLALNISPTRMILGGGSNLLFTHDYNGLVLRNEIFGIDIIKEDERHVYVRVGGGESWHGFVLYCIERNFGGVENLALIPGKVGAAPMQNIGAYGVEIKDVFYELEAFDLHEKKTSIFTNTDCDFGYRESVFKKRLKDRFVILHVVFQLDKFPQFNTSYGAIGQELKKMNEPVSIQSIAQAVMNIRTAKLPDPKKIGNAGSFFKNPVIPAHQYAELKKTWPAIPGYIQEDGSMKLAAGWLIEQSGWKGHREGDAGCHKDQALVLVNHGRASGKEILQLSESITESVQEKFGVALEREVNVI